MPGVTLSWPSLLCPFLSLPYNCATGSGSAGQRSSSGEYNLRLSFQRTWKMEKVTSLGAAPLLLCTKAF